MIKVIVSRIPQDGLFLEGEEKSSSIDMEYSQRCNPTGNLHYKLNVTLVGRNVLVTGSAFVNFICLCDNCNLQFTEKIENKNICRLYENVSEGEIDLTEDLREDILISLPLRLLCKDSCKGICCGCGADLNISKCSCSKTEDRVSTWEELNKIKF